MSDNNMKPIFEKPIYSIVIGVVVILVSIILESLLNVKVYKIMDYEVSGFLILTVLGVLITLWPFLKRGYKLYKNNKK